MNLVVQKLFWLLSRLPRRLLQWFGRMIGLASSLLQTRAARVTAANLTLSKQDGIVDVSESLIATGQTLMETPAVWLGARDKIDNWIDQVHGEDKLRAALASDRGLLILLPHLGNWELFNVFYRRYGFMTALYQPPRQASMASLMAEVRSRHGNEMVPTDRRGVMRLYRVLNDGGTVVVLPDQVPASGRYIPFFGQLALTDELSARLLQKTGAVALGLGIIRTADGRFDIHIVEPDEAVYSTDIDESLRTINGVIEQFAAMAPAQYQWEYKRYRERPAGEEKIYRFRGPPGVHR